MVEQLDLDRGGLLAFSQPVDVLWVRLRTQIDAEVMDALPGLRAIVTATTGLNHINLEDAEKRGISVLSLKGETEFLTEIRATAEAAVMLMLTLLRRFPEASRMALHEPWDRERVKASELDKKTVGIYGYGRLGRIVAGYCLAFRCRVLACDIQPFEPAPGVTAAGPDTLLAESDIVSLHADYRPENRRFFGADHFAKMKPGARFINTARGELVDEDALLAALSSGRLAGAAVDVLADETTTGQTGHPLIDYARQNSSLILTPHIGGATVESMHKTEDFLAARLLQWREASCGG